MTPEKPHECEVVVVGAGQAGLAVGFYLREAGLRFSILDGNSRVGDSWASRWDSLRLFTPARYSHLPGRMLSSSDPWAHPGKDDVATYLEDYARAFALPVELNTTVTSVRRVGARFIVRTGRGTWRTDQVVVATGPFQVPVVPRVAHGLDAGVTQLHSADYKRPEQLSGEGAVLVVGGGNSGYQIALELARSGREVHLSRGEHNVSVPQRPLGRDIFWWQQVLGVLKVSAGSRLGRRMRENDRTIIGIPLRVLTTAGVQLHERVVDASGCTVSFGDGGALDVASVVWATGFKQDHSWLDVPGAREDSGAPIHHRGVSPVPGLYFLGLPWLHTTGSALLGFVASDAEHLADVIAGRRA